MDEGELGIMDWFVSILTITSMFFLSRKYWWAPIYTVFVQFAWTIYILKTRQYGLMLCTVVLLIMYLIAIPKWVKER